METRTEKRAEEREISDGMRRSVHRVYADGAPWCTLEASGTIVEADGTLQPLVPWTWPVRTSRFVITRTCLNGHLGDALSVLVSRRHCTIVASFCSGTLGATLIDHSVNGTFVGDTRLVRQPTNALTGIQKLQSGHKFALRTSAETTTRAFHITFRFVLDESKLNAINLLKVQPFDMFMPSSLPEGFGRWKAGFPTPVTKCLGRRARDEAMGDYRMSDDEENRVGANDENCDENRETIEKQGAARIQPGVRELSNLFKVMRTD